MAPPFRILIFFAMLASLSVIAAVVALADRSDLHTFAAVACGVGCLVAGLTYAIRQPSEPLPPMEERFDPPSEGNILRHPLRDLPREKWPV